MLISGSVGIIIIKLFMPLNDGTSSAHCSQSLDKRPSLWPKLLRVGCNLGDVSAFVNGKNSGKFWKRYEDQDPKSGEQLQRGTAVYE